MIPHAGGLERELFERGSSTTWVSEPRLYPGMPNRRDYVVFADGLEIGTLSVTHRRGEPSILECLNFTGRVPGYVPRVGGEVVILTASAGRPSGFYGFDSEGALYRLDGHALRFADNEVFPGQSPGRASPSRH